MLDSLRPHYAKAFRCLGSICDDTCCHGLDVVIDCATYPRLTQRIDGMRETTLLLSCPEAARLVLLNPKLIPSDDAANGNLPRYHRFSGIGSQPACANGSPHQFLWEVREFTLLLLRDRAYPLWQRLFLLGMFCRRLDEITRMRQLAVVPHLLREFAEFLEQGTLRSAMDGMPSQTALQLKVVVEMTTQYLRVTDASHNRLRECVQDFCDGIGYHAGIPVDSCAVSCEDAMTRFYRPFMDDRPFIMENYLVNYVFRTRFPYGVDAQGHPSDPFTEYLKMALLYTLVKSLLVGATGRYQKEISEFHVVKVVQSFAKGVEQNPNFRTRKSCCASLTPRV